MKHQLVSQVTAQVIVAAILLVVACTPGAPVTVDPEPQAPTPDRRLVLTFDDLPYQGPSSTFQREDRGNVHLLRSMNQELVDKLVAAQAPAIGFVNEGKLQSAGGTTSPERKALLEIWLAAGLELGNHSFSHPSLHDTPLDEFQEDVLLGERVTAELAAKHGQPAPRFFRHPFLHTGRSQEVKEDFERFLTAHGYRIAPVTIDNSEWIFAKAYALALAQDVDLAEQVADSYLDYMLEKTAFSERQSQDLMGREIPQVLLLHDNQLNADTIDRLIRRHRERGYRLIDLEQALDDPAFRQTDGYQGPAGISWIERWAFAEKRDKAFFAGAPTTPPWILELAEIESE